MPLRSEIEHPGKRFPHLSTLLWAESLSLLERACHGSLDRREVTEFLYRCNLYRLQGCWENLSTERFCTWRLTAELLEGVKGSRGSRVPMHSTVMMPKVVSGMLPTGRCWPPCMESAVCWSTTPQPGRETPPSYSTLQQRAPLTAWCRPT